MPDITGHAKKYLIVALQSSLYAFDLAQVAEVNDPQPTWPIPLTPPCYKGALNFHGDILPVIDLPLLLGLPECSLPGKLVVIHKDIASIGFLVDRVVKIVPETEIISEKEPENNSTDSVFSLPDGEITRLNLESLVLCAASMIRK